MSRFLESFDRALERATASEDPRELLRLLAVIVGPQSRGFVRERDERRAAAEREAIARAAARNRAEIVRELSDVDLRLAVIDALVAQGIARPVAAERTRDPRKVRELAESLDLI